MNNFTQTIFKRSAASIILGASLFFSTYSTAATQVLDGIAAVVDRDVVLKSELEARIALFKRNMKRNGQTPPPDAEMRTGMLNQMILESIQIQRGINAGVRISEEQIDTALARIAQSQGMSLDEFRNRLFAEDNYYAVREQVQRDMIIEQVQLGSLSQEINITPEEIDIFLNSPEGQELAKDRYQLLQIMAPLSGSASASQKAQAEQLLQQAKQRLAQSGNITPWLKQQGGRLITNNLGWKSLEELPSLYTEAAQTLSVGGVSDVLEAGNGLHLVQLLDTTNKPEMVQQYKSRHILVQTSAIIDDAKAQALVAEYKARAEAGEDFAELAKANSEDPGSGATGGNLGWSRPGAFVPEFEEQLAKLEVGEISEPFQTTFGWHVILLEDKKRTDMREDIMKGRVFGVLRDRKMQNIRDEWLQQLRDNAYVDIK